MKATTVGILSLLLLFGIGKLYAQSCAVIYTFVSLTDECDGGDPLPDGRLVCIFWDQDNDGPDGTDPLVEVGECPTCVNFNCFALNGLEMLGEPGTFFTDPAFCFGNTVPQPNAFFVRIHIGGNNNLCWTSEVFAMPQGIGEIELDEWVCGPCVDVPGQVTGLAASQDLCNQVQLSWETVPFAFVYQVLRDGQVIDLAVQTRYVDDTEGASGCRQYTVRAMNEAGSGPLSDPATGCFGTTLPQVNFISASREHDDRISLTWGHLANESGYEIWRTEFGHVRRYEKIADAAENQTSYEDYSAVAGQEYYYRVNGVSLECGAGLPSVEVVGRRVLVEPVTFREIVVTTNLSGAMSAATIDYDDDGDWDVIACGMFADKIVWYENDGSWNFTEHVIIAHLDGVRKFWYFDLDGDGDRDIIAVARFANQLAWWEKTPQGFTMHVISSSVMGACDFAVADVSPNGAWDIVTAAYDGGEISLWSNNGNEQFTRTVIADNFPGASSVVISNIDGDLDVDIIATAQIADEVACFVQQPNHTFEKVVWAEADGACDVIHPSNTDDVFFCAREEPLIAALEGPNHELHVITRLLSEPRHVSWGDIDNDTDPDLLVAANSEISWWRKSQNRYYRNVITDNLPQASYVAGTMVEGDGGLDLIVAGGSEIRIYLSSADSNLVSRVTLPREPDPDEPVDNRITSLPGEFALAANYPNPFNAQTSIRFSLPEASNARVTVFDVTGREIAVLAEGEFAAGAHTVLFDASNLSSGVYFYRLEAGAFGQTRKMVLLK